MKKISWSAGLALGLMVAQQAAAQVTPPQVGGSGLQDLSNGGGVLGALDTAIMIMLALAGTIAVMFLIYGGMQYIFSGANEDLAKQGKTTVRNAVIGIVIILLSYTILSVVFNTLA